MDLKSYIQIRGGNYSIEARDDLRIAVVRLPLPTDRSIKIEATSCHDKGVSEDCAVFDALVKAQEALDDLLATYGSENSGLR